MALSPYFQYYQGFDVMPKDTFKISPSRLSKFFDTTHQWFGENVLGDAPAFTGNTMSNLGTIVHGLAEMYTKTGAYDETIAEEYLASITDPEIDTFFIKQQYPTMVAQLVSQYLSKVTGEAEKFVYEEVIPGYYVGGSIDLIVGDEVVDFKTTSAKSIPTSVRREYFFQQLCYVWMLRRQGYTINRFRLVYITTQEVNRISEKTGKPMKDYPTQVGSVVHEVTSDDMVFIEDVLRLVAESVKAFKEYDELRHIIAQDMRLKVRKSKLFDN